MSTHTDGIALEEQHPEATGSKRIVRSGPQVGDVLASARTARADVYTISIVPAAAHLGATRYAEAVEKVRELAHGLKADGGFLVPRPSSIAYRALCVASAPVVVVPPEPLVP